MALDNNFMEAATKLTQITLPSPEEFLQPSSLLHSDTIAAAKGYLDILAQDLKNSYQPSRKRKAGGDALPSTTHLHPLYVKGFNHNQIWEQAKRILDSASAISSHDFALHQQNDLSPPSKIRKTSPAELSEASEISDEGEGSGTSDPSDASVQSDEDFNNEEDEEEEVDGGSDGEMGSENSEADEISASKPIPADRHGLNDKFFSIDEFNKQSAFFENQDSRRPYNTQEENSDDEVDWHGDPFASGGVEVIDQEDAGDMSDEEQDLELALHTAQALGADQEEDDDEEEDEDEDQDEDGTQIMYADFFDPPAGMPKKKKSKGEPRRKKPTEESNYDEAIDRAIADVRRDLLEESDVEDDVEEEAEGRTQKNMSSHEKRRAQIANEIRRLEAANVSKKDWTLMGEAHAGERPNNSLIEEDLEFERVGKPVPIITAETTNDIEALIKHRIITKNLDDLIRRQPVAINEQRDASRKKFTLDETKPQQGLAEMYEADHLRATDPTYVAQADAKLRKDQNEVIQLWNEISSQLDTLSNWHFKPRKPQAEINVITNADTIFMEDAQPTTNADAGVSGGLAPHEIYNLAERKTPGEIKLKSGTTLAKEEVSREAKLRHRRREKQKQKKREAQTGAKKEGTPSSDKQQVVSNLKKAGVKVIGKGGALTDVQGNKITESKSQTRDILKL
ncbi:U3 snoRNP protein [Myotisia sp. PD_48]|nr:U3 snoRNP protein [Myotisia sp. PD_48]